MLSVNEPTSTVWAQGALRVCQFICAHVSDFHCSERRETAVLNRHARWGLFLYVNQLNMNAIHYK